MRPRKGKGWEARRTATRCLFNLKDMATRRMFSKDITSSSDFLMMSQSAQNLYFHIGMNADDDGFCEIFTVMRMTESKPDDLSILHSKGFVFVYDSRICIVKDWHTNNQIRKDRYKQSIHLENAKFRELYVTIMADKIQEIPLYKELLSEWQPSDNQMATQYSIGKDSIGKYSTVKDISYLGQKKVEQTPSSIARKFFDEQEMREQVIQRFKEKGMDEEFVRVEIDKFVLYWTEPTKSGKKQLWETKKTFEVRRRIVTWFNNSKQINNYSKPKGKNYDE